MDFLIKSFFGGRQAMPQPSRVSVDEKERKRARGSGSGETGSRTPTLFGDVPTLHYDYEEERPVKRFRGERHVIPIAAEACNVSTTTTTTAGTTKLCSTRKLGISCLPEDVLAHCLGFLGSREDRFALQCTSKQFHKISSSDDMMRDIQVGGDKETGLNGIIQEEDTPETACERLVPFANAGNREAMYMLGIIKSYCHKDVQGGICLLKAAAKEGYVRASYALGLVLRDSQTDQANRYMRDAANAGYIPALQEVLSAREMKQKHGELGAEKLRLYLDPLCLNRLLSRFYCKEAELRDLSTSHCWNPLCGRWAFKTNGNHSTRHDSNNRRRPWSLRSAFRNTNSAPPSSLQAAAAAGNQDAAPPSPPLSCPHLDVRVSRMKMCSRCCRAKYCSKLCQVYDWRSGRHKMECQFL